MNTYILRPARELIAALAMLTLVLVQMPAPRGEAPVADPVGTGGWGSFALCLGCGVAAFTIASSGVGAVLAAAAAPGSAVALGGCIAACAEALE